MKPIKVGLIGIGSVGSFHVRSLADSKFFALEAVCDIIASRAENAARRYHAKPFLDHLDLIQSGLCDAVVIATPHYRHVPIALDCLAANLHVLVEKPLAVEKLTGQKFVEVARASDRVCALMYNQRTDPYYRYIKNFIEQGRLGQFQRVNWIITNWFRTAAYYRSSDWRATWAGEGGGILLNQCIHQIDLLQWLCGMPTAVQASCELGKFHQIEVEDNVNAFLQYDNGASGVFISSTGEFPGSNRLEISGDKAQLIFENNSLTINSNAISSTEFLQNSPESFQKPEISTEIITFKNHGSQHLGVLENFAKAIAGQEALIADACEGLKALELSNSFALSSLQNQKIVLPLNAQDYHACLLKLIDNSSVLHKNTINPIIYDDAYVDLVKKTRWASHK